MSIHLVCNLLLRACARRCSLASQLGACLLHPSCTCQGQVLVYRGPLMERPGEFVRVAVAWDDMPLTQNLGALLPWEVKWCSRHHSHQRTP